MIEEDGEKREKSEDEDRWKVGIKDKVIGRKG